jgi:ATP-dependent Clp protease adapter protein ClpS
VVVSAMLQTHRWGTYAVVNMEHYTAEATAQMITDRALQAGHPFKCILQVELERVPTA